MKKILVLLFISVFAAVGCSGLAKGLKHTGGTTLADVSNLTATAGNAEVQLSWTDPDMSVFEHVVVSYSPSGDDTIVKKGDQGFLIRNLTNEKEYVFTVTTVDAAGNESEGREIVATPSMPSNGTEITGLTVINGNKQVVLNWIDPVGADVKNIQVSWSDTVKTVELGVQTYTVTGLTNEENYTFTVKTVKKDGGVSSGVAITEKPDGTSPSEVTNVQSSTFDGSIALTWADPSDADFDHVVLSVTGNSKLYTINKGNQYFKAESLANGTSYIFKIMTVDKIGNTSTGENVSVKLPLLAPDEVTALTAAAGDAKVTLSWGNPSERFSHAEITWVPGGSTVQTTAGSGYTATGLANGTEYTFTVRTVGPEGAGSAGAVIKSTPVKSVNASEVSSLTAAWGNCKTTLNWIDPTDADVDHILVTRQSNGQNWTVSKGVQTLIVSGLGDAAEYSFNVCTVDSSGNNSAGSTVSGRTLAINAARAEKAKGIRYYNRMYIPANGAALHSGVVGSIPAWYQTYVTDKLNSRLAFPVSPKAGMNWYQSLPDAVSSYSSSMGWDPANDVTLATVDYMANNGSVLTNSLSALNSATAAIAGTDFTQIVADSYNPNTETTTSPTVDGASGYDSSKLLKMGVAIAAAYFGDFSGVMSLAGGSEAGYMKQIEAQLSQINAKLTQIEDKLDSLRGLVLITTAEEKRSWISTYRSYMNSVGNTLATLPVLSNPFDELYSFAKNTITGTTYFTNYDDTKTKALASQGIVKDAVKKDTLTVEVDVERTKLTPTTQGVCTWDDSWVFVSKTDYDFDKPAYLFTMQPQDMELLKRFGLTRLMFDQYLMGGATPQTGETVLALRRQQAGYDYSTFLDPSMSTSLVSGVNAEYSRYFLNSDSAVKSATIDQSTMPSMGRVVETLSSGMRSGVEEVIRPVKIRVRILDAAGTALYSREYTCTTSGKQITTAPDSGDPLSIPYISNTDHAAAITFVRNSLASYAHAKYDDQFKNVYTSIAEWAILAKANKEQ
jgi:outer membrane murein-binding lipoprotein Lpp